MINKKPNKSINEKSKAFKNTMQIIGISNSYHYTIFDIHYLIRQKNEKKFTLFNFPFFFESFKHK